MSKKELIAIIKAKDEVIASQSKSINILLDKNNKLNKELEAAQRELRAAKANLIIAEYKATQREAKKI